MKYIACGAKTRAGTPCQIKPIEGSKRCKHHGGLTPRGMNSPHYKTGNHIRYPKEKVLQKITTFKNDQDVRDLRDEMAILRGILHSYIDSTNGQHHILSNRSIDLIVKVIDKIEKLVSSLKIIEEGHTFTIKNVQNVLVQVVRIIKKRVKEPATRAGIAKDLKGMNYISLN